jgi:hypothetical protein
MTVTPFFVPTTSMRRRMPAKVSRAFDGLGERHAERAHGAEGRQRIGDIVGAGDVEDDLQPLAAGPLGQIEGHAGRQGLEVVGRQVGAVVAEGEGDDGLGAAVIDHRLGQGCGLDIVEVEHGAFLPGR